MFELLFGGIFAGVGLAVAVPFFIVGLVMRDWLFTLIGLLIGLVFGGIGIAVLVVGFKKMKRTKEIIQNGRHIDGKIVDYRDDFSTYVNNIPAYDIIVRCYVDGQNMICQLPTGQTNESKYPLGASVTISVLNDEVVIVPNSVKNIA